MISDNCNIPCITCRPLIPGSEGFGLNPLDPDYPYLNLSAELPDVDKFVSVRPDNLGFPPLGSNWYAVGCIGFCISSTSQEDADLCAVAQAALCVSTQWPVSVATPPLIPGQPPVVTNFNRAMSFNTPQTCSIQCQDGSMFTYVTPAGKFVAVNAETANAWAASYACTKAPSNLICIPNLVATGLCINQVYSETIIITAANLPVGAEIVSGAMPPGISLAQNPNPNFPAIIFSGVPTEGGSFVFTMRVTDQLGNFATRTFTLNTAGFVGSGTLPDATQEVPYLFQLTTEGVFANAAKFYIVSGSLPDGLFLNEDTGEVFGTPTVDGAFQIEVSVSDSLITCNKIFDIFVQDGVSECGQIFSGLTWDYIIPTGNASGTPDANSITLEATGPGEGMGTAAVQALGRVFYQGPQKECTLKVEISGNSGASIAITQISAGDLLLWTYGSVLDTPGTYFVPFIISEDLVGNDIIITGVSDDAMVSSGDDKTINVTFTIGV